MLNSNIYNLEKACCWGLFLEHAHESFKGNLGNRVVHGLIAAAEFLPVISQIVSLFEMVIASCCLHTDSEITEKEEEIISSPFIERAATVGSTDSGSIALGFPFSRSISAPPFRHILELGDLDFDLPNIYAKKAAYIEKSGDTRPDDLIFLAVLNNEYRTKGCTPQTYSTLFPGRTITPQEVAKLSYDELKALPIERYYAILDLLPDDLLIQVITDTSSDIMKRMQTLAWHPRAKELYRDLIREKLDEPIHTDTKEHADALLATIPRLTDEDYHHLQEEKPDAFHDYMMKRVLPSNTLRYLRSWDQGTLGSVYWNNLHNNAFFIQGIVDIPVDRDLFHQIRVLCDPDYIAQTDPFRHIDLLVAGTDIDFPPMPTSLVSEEFDLFLTWLNEKLILCDEGKENPIVIAALAYQRFITLHPLQDANGRTGRILSDMILRRYDILPPSWTMLDGSGEEQPMMSFVKLADYDDTSIDPTTMVEQMLQSIQLTYALFNE